MTKYPWDGESRPCYCKRESRAGLALFWRSEKSRFSSQLLVQVASGVPQGVEGGICAIQCGQTVLLQNDCAILVL